MTLFSVPEANYFATQYTATPGPPAGSFRTHTDGLRTGQSVTEGTPAFAELRDGSLRESERCLFLALSQYRRAFDLMTPSASSWAHVTCYYGVFFAATSLMGMFGVWKLTKDKMIDVVVGTPGGQELAITRFPSSYSGSHRAFWDLFYTNVAALFYSVDPLLRFAIQPVSGNRTWHIDMRNEVNYDAYQACQLMGSFQVGFRKSKLRATLPGTLNTQFRILEALLEITTSFARSFGLATDALSHLVPAGNRRTKIRELILDAEFPSLGRYVKRRTVLG